MSKALLRAGEELLARVGHALEHHPRTVTALLAAMMLGGGGGAFAVASLAPDPAAMPVREVVELVEHLPLQSQSDALQVHNFELFTTDTVRATDTVQSLLARLGVNDPAAAAWIQRDPAARSALLGTSGRVVRAEATDDRNLLRLVVRSPSMDPARFQRFIVERQPSGQLGWRTELAPYAVSTRLGTGTLRSSLFAAVDEAHIPDEVATQLVDIFSDINFHRDLRRGDRFNVVYELLEADGEPLAGGRVLSAEFVNNGRIHQALWFQEPGKAGGYYGFDGTSLERSFLASPMQVTRVTSGFAMRFHPIQHAWKAHRGVDYGAPVGAPVRSVGEGKVEFAGWMGGYGNVVQIDHGKGDSTVYAHLSRIDVRPGAPVQRGQRIGAVGQTGWATGPHLHFEFRENGVQRDPLEVARRQPPTELSAQFRPDFERAVIGMRTQLALAASPVRVASAQ